MHQCPHCGKPAITFWRKAILGPGAPVPCQACEKDVKVSFPDWLKGALPGAAVMVAALFFDSDLIVYGLSVIGLTLMIGLQMLWVPLVKD